MPCHAISHAISHTMGLPSTQPVATLGPYHTIPHTIRPHHTVPHHTIPQRRILSMAQCLIKAILHHKQSSWLIFEKQNEKQKQGMCWPHADRGCHDCKYIFCPERGCGRVVLEVADLPQAPHETCRFLEILDLLHEFIVLLDCTRTGTPLCEGLGW